MINITLPELLALWDELRDAEAGTNRWGGDTAELYAFRFGRHCPQLDIGGFDPNSKFRMEDALGRSKALYELLDHYAKTRGARIRVNGRLYGKWILKEPFVHRCHVQVAAKGVAFGPVKD